MTFHLLPVADIMITHYQTPVNADRFTNYMKILQGNSPGDITVPVTFYNPMGKEHVLKKLLELKKLKVEELMKETLIHINKSITSFSSKEIHVSVALADDLGGGWTNRYTTDYDSKFNVTDLIKRNFCNPLFWVSEDFSADKIKERTADYCFRFLYREKATQPLTLEEHIQQEVFVTEHNPFRSAQPEIGQLDKVSAFYNYYKDSTSYPLIFNFLYGDAASRELGYAAEGISMAWAGYAYAAFKSQEASKLMI